MDVEIGVRHEDYDLDAVTKPSGCALGCCDTIALRASYEQVFRVPVLPITQRFPWNFTHLWVSICQSTPVPTSLAPEESNNFNIGAILAPIEGLTMTIDYYNMSLLVGWPGSSHLCIC